MGAQIMELQCNWVDIDRFHANDALTNATLYRGLSAAQYQRLDNPNIPVSCVDGPIDYELLWNAKLTRQHLRECKTSVQLFH